MGADEVHPVTELGETMGGSRYAEVIATGEADGGHGPATSGSLAPFASFARFVLLGGGVGLLSSAAVPEVAGVMPWAVANALITVVSTLLCTELHSLVTFGTGRLAGWRRHLQSAGSAAASYAVTTAAVLLLHTVQPTAGKLLEQAVYLGAAALAGIGRFLVLRLFVFAADRDLKADSDLKADRDLTADTDLTNDRDFTEDRDFTYYPAVFAH